MADVQKAIVVQEIGKPAVLVNDWPVPEPGPGQVQVKVKVAALNPHDYKIRDLGLYVALHNDMLPWIPSNDVVGTISALGTEVTGLAVGDRFVFGTSFAPFVPAAIKAQAGLQEFALANAAGPSCKIPDGVSDDEAATLPTNLTSVWGALFITLGIKVPWEGNGQVPESILIVGGGSNCGRLAVQLAKIAGIRTIIVVGGKEQELQGLGATHVLDRHADEAGIISKVKEATQDSLIYALDAVNAPKGLCLAAGALSSKQKGKVARLASPRAEVPDGLSRGHELLGVSGPEFAAHASTQQMWRTLPEWLVSGAIKPTPYEVVAETLDAGKANEALDKYRDGVRQDQPHVHIS